ncbi:MAG: RNHCP domain-containing protein [Candidatus Moraniibacteriota bacterium]
MRVLSEPSKKFQKRIEDFVCEHCGASVSGTGFTNHCPECLYSLHVDVYPGDRKAKCRGLMAPVRVESKGAQERLVHQCLVCGYQKVNKVEKEDSRETLLIIARESASRF